MTRVRNAGALAVALLASAPPVAAQVVSQRYDLERREARFDLPGRLSEVSGLAVGSDGGLLAHGDERAMVFRISPSEQVVDRGFSVGGDGPLRDDFEGIAVAEGRGFLVSSRGLLYEFRVAPAGAASPARVTDTGLGAECEVEGLAYHASTRALLLACKSLTPMAAEVRIHRLPLDPGATPLPPIRVPWARFAARGHGGEVSPSAVEVDPASGTLLLLAARQELLFEIDLEGNLLDLVRLSPGRHPQPEGLAVGTDGRLYVADEANGRDARITVYVPREEGVRR